MTILKFSLVVEYFTDEPNKYIEKVDIFDQNRKVGKIPTALEFDLEPSNPLKKLTTIMYLENGEKLDQEFYFPRTLESDIKVRIKKSKLLENVYNLDIFNVKNAAYTSIINCVSTLDVPVFTDKSSRLWEIANKFFRNYFSETTSIKEIFISKNFLTRKHATHTDKILACSVLLETNADLFTVTEIGKVLINAKTSAQLPVLKLKLENKLVRFSFLSAFTRQILVVLAFAIFSIEHFSCPDEIDIENIVRFALGNLYEFTIPVTAKTDFKVHQNLEALWTMDRAKRYCNCFGLEPAIEKIKVSFK